MAEASVEKLSEEEIGISEAARKRVEELIEEEEGVHNRYGGMLAVFLSVAAVVMSLFHLYAAVEIVPAFILRPTHVAFTLALVFLIFPAANRFRHRLMWWDVIFALVTIGIAAYILYWGDLLGDRATVPTTIDQVIGVALILLILEGNRRSSTWILPFVVSLFLAYALLGAYLPAPWTHKGYEISRLVGALYMTLEGIFGVAVDVSSTLIILFTIFGAFLQYSGAGRFFLDFSFAAMGGKPSSAGRAVVMSSFLLGGPSGSGVATTVTIGSVAYPLLAKAGYGKEAAGGLLAAGGLGAIISPPVLGAAAFLIAEFLRISYLDVILMAAIPTILFYLGIFVMVEIDARKFAMHAVKLEKHQRALVLAKRYWYHFISLVSIVFFMLLGYSPILSVFYATVVTALVSFFQSDSALIPYDWFRGRLPWLRGFWDSGFIKALEGGSVGVLNVAMTCASAGIIVGVVTLTGLGLKFSSIVLDYANSGSQSLVSLWVMFGADRTPELLHAMKLLLTAFYTSLIVWIVGLAVPVTASYIICAVIAAPALIKLGVPDFAAHMFIFYYAVLSEVSPPTALSPFAAAAITGGGPYRTTLQCWKYTAPAFLVPFMFVLDPSGSGLLLGGSFKNLAQADWGAIALITVTAAIGIVALAGGLQGWLLRRTNLIERWMLIIAGLALVYPTKTSDMIGLSLVALVLVMQKFLPARAASA
ncbi:MAG: TRAP transporter fused permease subunit [Betaproteobacteria bacterium]|jgi:TRAP transporter 4TM/12TM fusion protein|nr:TRAP transporter fused permease subunit [Betaproteobacteria bacterium]MDH5341732.1 TRAP transporter fused permease subunit [Betaproteobacteria bacterium]